MFPRLTASNSGYLGLAYAKQASCFLLICRVVSDLLDKHFCQFGSARVLATRSQTMQDCMGLVFLRGHVFQILYPVVRLIAVLVVHLFSCGTRAVKGVHDKAVNKWRASSLVSRQNDMDIAMPVYLDLSDGSLRRHIPNTSERGHFINALIAWNRSPFFADFVNAWLSWQVLPTTKSPNIGDSGRTDAKLFRHHRFTFTALTNSLNLFCCQFCFAIQLTWMAFRHNGTIIQEPICV